MISAKNISKSFGSLQVLKSIDLEINKGEIVSIVGPSGAGKTTFLQILGTLSKQDTGSVIINGISIDNLNSNQMAHFRNRNLGFVFQFHNLLPEFTALENVCLPAYIARKSKKDTIKRAKELLDFLNVSHRLEHKPSELSGGEQQRVAVARALINSPQVLLADEPSGNLDSKSKNDLHELFFRLRKEFDITFVIVTHNASLSEMSDRTIYMEDGKITPFEDLKTNLNLK